MPGREAVRPQVEILHAEIAVPAAARWGQAPTWDVGTETVLWVDPPARTVHRHVPGGADHTMTVAQHVSAAKPRSVGGLVLHLAEGVALFSADGSQRTWLVYWARDGVHGGETMIDVKGRLWATTVHPAGPSGDGWLARIDPDGSAALALRDLSAGYGIGWSPDSRLLYVSDAAARRIDVLDFDPATGAATGRRVFHEVDGQPSGLCVDAVGAVWVAVRDTGEIHVLDSDGVARQRIPLPVQRPTGCCFGGDELTDLYVTSASDGLPAPTRTDGSLLVLPCVGTGTRGYAFAG